MIKKVLLFVFLIPSIEAFPQKNDHVGATLLDLFTRLSVDSDVTERIKLNDSIRLFAGRYAASDSVFKKRYRIRSLGQITSPDSSLKIITWNFLRSGYDGKYFCYLVKKEPGKNIVCSLASPYRTDSIDTDKSIKSSDWYGALYYDARRCPGNENDCWLLTGLDYGNPDISKKVIDVLTFLPDGSVSFGKKWFRTPSGLRSRVVFEYSSSGLMTLRFSSDTTIIFDHLVPFSPDKVKDHSFYGPDYSYDKYAFRNGNWIFIRNVDVRNKE